MKRIVITNNRKVAKHCANRADVSIKDMASGLDVLQEGLKIASQGGRLLLDPTRRKGYYKSLIFYLEEKGQAPDEKSIALLSRCMEEMKAQDNDAAKEPILAGILQNRDLNLVKSIIQ